MQRRGWIEEFSLLYNGHAYQTASISTNCTGQQADSRHILLSRGNLLQLRIGNEKTRCRAEFRSRDPARRPTPWPSGPRSSGLFPASRLARGRARHSPRHSLESATATWKTPRSQRAWRRSFKSARALVAQSPHRTLPAGAPNSAIADADWPHGVSRGKSSCSSETSRADTGN